MFLYKLFPIENRPNFRFLGTPESQIKKKYLFSRSLLWQCTSAYQNLKGWLSQKCELFSFIRCPYDNNFRPISLGDLNIILVARNIFFRKLPQKLWSSCFLKIFENTAFGHVTEVPVITIKVLVIQFSWNRSLENYENYRKS